MLFSHKFIEKRGKKTVTAGANNIFIQSVKLCQKERTKFDEKYA